MFVNRRIFLLSVCLAAASCTSIGQISEEEKLVQREFSDTGVAAIEVAKQYLNDRKIGYADTTVKADWHSDAWWIIFSEKVPKPGSDFVVRVSHEGKALGLDPGY